jgi:hypothetical protein
MTIVATTIAGVIPYQVENDTRESSVIALESIEVFWEYKTKQNVDLVSIEEFNQRMLDLATSKDERLERAFCALLDCHGLLPVIVDRTWSKVAYEMCWLEEAKSGNIPDTPLPRLQKSGFLRKNYDGGLYQTWNLHWCTVARGFLWYYSTPTGTDADKVFFHSSSYIFFQISLISIFFNI